MKLTVHYKHQIHMVPCGNGNNPIKWLKEETIRRCKKTGLLTDEDDTSDKYVDSLEVRLKQTHGLLMDDDLICDVLDDNSLVYIASRLKYIRFFNRKLWRKIGRGSIRTGTL